MKTGDIPKVMDRAAEFLLRRDLLALDPDTAGNMAREAREIADRVRAADDRLVVGLVGGTGVGKSTLINALAGREISARTDVRPTTTHLILYRHRNNDHSLSPDEEVYSHDALALERVSLADFPDFDSIEPAHRETLAALFPRLDLLLWVVEPVKYADQAFFHWLDLAPQARVNSLFIFNKKDEFKARYKERADEVIRRVGEDFKEKLSRYAGIGSPEVIFLSALDVVSGRNGRTESGFAELTARLDELREKKKRLAIKSRNLEKSAMDILTGLRQAADPAPTREGAARLKASIEEEKRAVAGLIAGEAVNLKAVLKKPWRDGLTAGARDNAPWPLDFFLFLWERLLGLFRRSAQKSGPGDLPRPELASLSRNLAGWRSRAVALLKGQAARAWGETLEKTPPPEDVAGKRADALVRAGREAAHKLTTKKRWRVRHHLLPLLVLAYPFLPLIMAWAAGESAARVNLDMGWRDLLPVLEVILALYLLQTVYFVYSLDKAAARALDRLIDAWAGESESEVDGEVFQPSGEFAEKLAGQLDEIERLTEPADVVPDVG